MVAEEMNRFMADITLKNPHEPEFCQAVHEVLEDIFPCLNDYPEFHDSYILKRITEPDRAVMFRVSWMDDSGVRQVNRGYRVQFCNTLGPYKGGLRFHPTVNLSIIKFLAFEQTFKNSLLPLGLGGAKGGADFDPRGRSDRDIMAFCQSFMTELIRHIGSRRDVPAGDIGVGNREIGYLFGQYKRINDDGAGVLTGKESLYGGSLLRPEATGYGCVYFAREVLNEQSEGLEGKRCSVSGSGNVAIYAAEKLHELGARVQTLSDSSGVLYCKEGLDREKLNILKVAKFQKRSRLSEVADSLGCHYAAKASPWHYPCDMAFPCATQNEIDGGAAKMLAKNGCRWVLEGANMPVTRDAGQVLREYGVVTVPGKAANAGGVAVSGLEMTQNATGLPWSREEVDRKLQTIMEEVHRQCLNYGKGARAVNYAKGANISAFLRIARSIQAQGF